MPSLFLSIDPKVMLPLARAVALLFSSCELIMPLPFVSIEPKSSAVLDDAEASPCAVLSVPIDGSVVLVLTSAPTLTPALPAVGLLTVPLVPADRLVLEPVELPEVVLEAEAGAALRTAITAADR